MFWATWCNIETPNETKSVDKMPSWPTCHIMFGWLVPLMFFFPPGNPSEPLTWTTPRAVGAAKWRKFPCHPTDFFRVGVQRTCRSVEVVTDVVRLAEAWDNEMRISQTAAAAASQIRRQELHQARSAAMHQTRMEAILFIEESHGIQWSRKTCGVGLWKWLPNLKHCLKNAQFCC